MHPYFLEHRRRNIVVASSIVLAILAAYALHFVVQYAGIEIWWWIETPSVLGFYGLIMGFFDRVVWRWKMLDRLGYGVPDLNGQWKVVVKSSSDGLEKLFQADAVIRQTWSKICIVLTFPASASRSLTAFIICDEALNGFELVYAYESLPKADAVGTMNIHRGTTWLSLSKDEQILDGEYYTGRGRHTYGRITLTRCPVILPTIVSREQS